MAITSPELQVATERVKALFASTGMGVDPFEKAIGVSQGTIKSIRNGRNFASADCIIKVAKYFNVSIDYMLGFTDERRPLECRDVGQVNSSAASVPAMFGDMPDLLSEERFVNTAKIYHELPDELRERAYMLIYGIAVGIGLNVEKIIGR